VADDFPIEHGLLQRHRDVILSLEPNRRLELTRTLDGRELEHPDRDTLIGDSKTHVPRQLLRREEVLDSGTERLGICDLAILEHAGIERCDPVLSDPRAAIHSQLRGRDAARLDVEADDGLFFALA
jgi:hypothetical protein